MKGPTEIKTSVKETEEGTELVIERVSTGPKDDTVQGAAQQIEEDLGLVLNHSQRLGLQATIKRLVHWEKLGVYRRMDRSLRDFLPEHFKVILRTKIETHKKMAQFEDRDVITWEVPK